MRSKRTLESRRDRREMVKEAGWGRISLASMFAGALVAFGAFSILFSVAAAIARASDSNSQLYTLDWKTLSAAGAVIIAVVLFFSYLFGGYVAGRMARRSGTAHGVGAFFVGLLLTLGAAGFVRAVADEQAVLANLRSTGAPTAGSQFNQVATVAGVVALAVMFLGALIGGVLGERWHARLLTRALDADVGPAADARRESAQRSEAESEVAGAHYEGAREHRREMEDDKASGHHIDLTDEERAAQAHDR